MMMGGLFAGSNLAKPKAPTRVTLIPANMMQSPQAQHRAGDGWLYGRRDRVFFAAVRCGSCSVQIIVPVESPHFLFEVSGKREKKSGTDSDD